MARVNVRDVPTRLLQLQFRMHRARLPIERGYVPRVPYDSQMSFFFFPTSSDPTGTVMGAARTHVPAVSRIPRSVWAPVESPLLTARGSLLPRPAHDLVLTHPPRLLHIAFRPYNPRIAGQEQRRILEKRLGACRMGSLAVELRPQLQVLDVGVFRCVLGWRRARTERSWQGRILRDGDDRSVGRRARFGRGILAGVCFLGLFSVEFGCLFL